jgi:predicted esterase
MLSLSPLPRRAHLLVACACLLLVSACGGDERRLSGGIGITVNAAASGAGPASGSGGQTSSSEVGSGVGGGDTGPTPPEEFIPKAVGNCPEFKSGKVSFGFGGDEPREAEVWTGEKTGGPLVIVWHSLEAGPLEAIDILGQDVIDAVTAQGGAVVAPYADPDAGFNTWFFTLGNFMVDDDMRLSDEIVACAIAKQNINTRRLYTVGFDLGAMQAVQLAVWRSGYIASIVAHSTSLVGAPAEQDPNNLYAAMVLHGGLQDSSGFEYNVGSEQYVDMLRGDMESTISGQHFAVLCVHGGGHIVAEDARSSAYAFLLAHPYATHPSPYADALPDGFPVYCDVAK